MISIGVIGYGYWGPNFVRNFFELPDAKVVGVSDLSSERLKKAGIRYPSIKLTTDHHELIQDPKIDAIAIATPVSTHFDIALESLRAGKHVLITKPMTATAEQAQQLIEEASSRKLILMVDHTFIYTDAVRWIKRLMDQGELGQLYYYDSVRINLGLFQHDVNVVWDLAVHDLAVMDYVIGQKPQTISAVGASHVSGKPENMAYITCLFPNSLIAHIHVNWLAPVKVRSTLIGGDRKMIVYNDLEPHEKIKVYDKGITMGQTATQEGIYDMLVGYRIGDMWSPKLDMQEALHTELQHFIQCIEQRGIPQSDGESGLRVVKMLEAATASMKDRGRMIELDLKVCGR